MKSSRDKVRSIVVSMLASAFIVVLALNLDIRSQSENRKDELSGLTRPGPRSHVPELPRKILNSDPVTRVSRVIRPANGHQLQLALDTAKSGDAILLNAGMRYVAPSGGFILRSHRFVGDNDWITLETEGESSLSASKRQTPDPNHKLAGIVTSDGAPALITEARANGYRIVGLEFTAAKEVASNSGLIQLGKADETNVDLSSANIIIDRCYIHGNSDGNIRRGIALNSASTAVVNSYLSDFHDRYQDSQAIAGWNGPGPFKIVNNYLEGAGENIMFGGGDPHIRDLVPTDIEFRDNYCTKPLSWRESDPSFSGRKWVVKNLFELKNARRVLIEANTFENCWTGGQVGFAMVLKSTNQDGSAPWSVTEDVTVRHNIIRHVASAINIRGRENANAVHPANSILIVDNLFEDVNGPKWGGSGIFVQISDTQNVKVDHNTVFHTGNFITTYEPASAGFVFTNNIVSHNIYGLKGDGKATGRDSIETYFPDGIFLKNIIVGLPENISVTNYPRDNFFPKVMEDFFSADGKSSNYRLAANSPFRMAGTDQKDIGCSVDNLLRSTTEGSQSEIDPRFSHAIAGDSNPVDQLYEDKAAAASFRRRI